MERVVSFVFPDHGGDRVAAPLGKLTEMSPDFFRPMFSGNFAECSKEEVALTGVSPHVLRYALHPSRLNPCLSLDRAAESWGQLFYMGFGELARGQFSRHLRRRVFTEGDPDATLLLWLDLCAYPEGPPAWLAPAAVRACRRAGPGLVSARELEDLFDRAGLQEEELIEAAAVQLGASYPGAIRWDLVTEYNRVRWLGRPPPREEPRGPPRPGTWRRSLLVYHQGRWLSGEGPEISAPLSLALSKSFAHNASAVLLGERLHVFGRTQAGVFDPFLQEWSLAPSVVWQAGPRAPLVSLVGDSILLVTHTHCFLASPGAVREVGSPPNSLFRLWGDHGLDYSGRLHRFDAAAEEWVTYSPDPPTGGRLDDVLLCLHLGLPHLIAPDEAVVWRPAGGGTWERRALEGVSPRGSQSVCPGEGDGLYYITGGDLCPSLYDAEALTRKPLPGLAHLTVRDSVISAYAQVQHHPPHTWMDK